MHKGKIYFILILYLYNIFLARRVCGLWIPGFGLSLDKRCSPLLRPIPRPLPFACFWFMVKIGTYLWGHTDRFFTIQARPKDKRRNPLRSLSLLGYRAEKPVYICGCPWPRLWQPNGCPYKKHTVSGVLFLAYVTPIPPPRAAWALRRRVECSLRETPWGSTPISSLAKTAREEDSPQPVGCVCRPRHGWAKTPLSQSPERGLPAAAPHGGDKAVHLL